MASVGYPAVGEPTRTDPAAGFGSYGPPRDSPASTGRPDGRRSLTECTDHESSASV